MAAKKKYSLPNALTESLDLMPGTNPTAYYKELHKVQEDLSKELESRRKIFTSKYKHCSTCGKYYLRKDEKKDSVNELHRGVCVWTDCGYGDDDVFADVTYLVTYAICPLCKKHNDILSKFTINESNRRDRWGNHRGR